MPKDQGYSKLKRIIIFIALITLLPLSKGIPQNSPSDKLAEAEKYYESAQFDKAIDVLQKLSADSTDKTVQKNALRFLGRAYAAKGLYDKAKDAILELLKLEPPMVVFNPDYEPPVFMKLYYEARKEYSGSYKVEEPDPGMKTMAIIDFENQSIDHREKYNPMKEGFADLMINRLNNSTDLKVVERERINWILNEIKLQHENNMQGAVRLGKQLGVQTVLLGSFIIVGDQIWLGARLVKVESSQILLTDEVKGDLDNFFKLVDELGQKIAKNINVTLKKETTAQVSSAPSLDAIMAYSVGLNYLEKEDYKDAYAKFQEALKIDPNYNKAKLRAQSIAPLLN